MKYLMKLNGYPKNTIEADEDFAKAYAKENGYEFEILPDVVPNQYRAPTPDEDRDAMLADLAYRTALLELGVN